MLHKIRIIAWVAVGLALIGFAVILLTRPSGNQPASAPTANYGGPFTLVSSDGKAFPSTRLAGRPYAIFFGFTHCPDVCPTTLARRFDCANNSAVTAISCSCCSSPSILNATDRPRSGNMRSCSEVRSSA